jgi:hypothetical protein
MQIGEGQIELRGGLFVALQGRCTLNGGQAAGLEKLSGSGDTLRCFGPKGDDCSDAPLSVDALSVWHVQIQAGACPKMGSSTLLCVMITYGGHDDNTSMHRMRRKYSKIAQVPFLCVWEMC